VVDCIYLKLFPSNTAIFVTQILNCINRNMRFLSAVVIFGIFVFESIFI